MEKETRNSIIILWVSFWISIILFYSIQFSTLEGKQMEWWGYCISGAAVVIAAIITGFITYLVNRNSQLKKNTDAIGALESKIGSEKYERSLQTQIGIKDNDKTLSEQLGVNSAGKSISEQLGVKSNDKSLSLQNAEILKAVNSYKENETENLKRFGKKQKDIAKTVDDVNCFLKDWEQKTIEANELKKENETLNKKISELTVANAEQITQLRSELTKANKIIKEQSEALYSLRNEQENDLER